MRRLALSALLLLLSLLLFSAPALAQPLTGGFTTRMSAAQGNCVTSQCNAQSPTWCVTSPPDGQVYICNVASGFYEQQTSWHFPGTMAQPAAPVASLLGTLAGTCRQDTTYRIYVSYTNVSGETQLSLASNDFKPASGNTNRINVTRGAIPTNANRWRAWFSRDLGGENHSVIRGCGAGASIEEKLPSDLTAACPCSLAADAQEPTSNTTRTVYSQRSIASPSALSMSRPEVAVKEVCPLGCDFTTTAAAMAAITDASATKRYQVKLRAPYYNSLDAVTMKSYVHLAGDGANTTVINAVTLPAGLVDATISDVGVINGFSTSGVGGGPVYLDRVNCGALATGQGQPSACWNDQPFGQWTVYATDVYFALNNDNNVIFPGPRSRWIGTGNRYRTDVNAISHTGCWAYNNGSDDGVEIIDVGSTCELNYLGDPGDSIQGAFRWVPTGSTSTVGNFIDLSGTVIKITNPNASGTPASLRCLYMDSTGPNTKPSRMVLTGTRCQITTANASQELRGMEINADADWANWTIAWDGGSIDLIGGAAHYDVDNADTTLVPTLTGVRHSGSYTGAGTVAAGDARLGAFSSSLQGPSGNCCPATCTIGQTFDDTTATTEWCVCTATNTWKCVTLPNAGPVD
jgi:hypothetical protein